MDKAAAKALRGPHCIKRQGCDCTKETSSPKSPKEVQEDNIGNTKHS